MERSAKAETAQTVVREIPPWADPLAVVDASDGLAG
jgi:hypothetical protein